MVNSLGSDSEYNVSNEGNNSSLARKIASMTFPNEFSGAMGTGKDIVGKIGFPQLVILRFIYKLILKPVIHLKHVKFTEGFMILLVSVSQRNMVKVYGRVD